ncbi:MAG: methyltransferase domain-containing protein [Gammaproteobacteria bacterium]|nr:methyltransferase domain-containing protein [Gammaproteobacteria bacterium]
MTEAQIEKTQVTEVYRKIAPIYDGWAWLTETRARERCLELAAIRDGERILEVAVGTGLAFEKILRSNPSGHNEGIDLTEAMLMRAQRKAARTGLHNYRLCVGDACALEFPDLCFDVVINNYMFDLLPEKDFATVLEEFKRVLRPGGRLVLVNMAIGTKWYHGLWDLIYRISPALLGGCRSVSLSPHLEHCGYRQIRREFVSQMTFPSEIITALSPAPSR